MYLVPNSSSVFCVFLLLLFARESLCDKRLFCFFFKWLLYFLELLMNIHFIYSSFEDILPVDKLLQDFLTTE